MRNSEALKIVRPTKIHQIDKVLRQKLNKLKSIPNNL